MQRKRISASVFKARCLSLLDEVAAGGPPIVVTKRGKPVAQVVAVEEPRPLAGSVEVLVDQAALLAPVEGAWEAETS